MYHILETILITQSNNSNHKGWTHPAKKDGLFRHQENFQKFVEWSAYLKVGYTDSADQLEQWLPTSTCEKAPLLLCPQPNAKLKLRVSATKRAPSPLRSAKNVPPPSADHLFSSDPRSPRLRIKGCSKIRGSRGKHWAVQRGERDSAPRRRCSSPAASRQPSDPLITLR